MRDVLFRGKRVDNGEWETGSLVITRSGCSDEQVFITDKMTGYLTPVIPETVGQYIGAADKNGCKIFEGDVVLYFGEINLVEWNDFDASFSLLNEDDERCYFDAVDNDSMFIIGNIFDNPELLENNTGKENSI